jgi:nucleoid-associated protein YgaU
MRPSIVRDAHEAGAEVADGAIDGLLDAVSGSNVRDLVIETAHGKTVVSGLARYQLDREQLFDTLKRLRGWERDIVLEIEVERTDVRGYHTVGRGETLASIAERYLGSAEREMAIFDANRDRMNDPDQIMPGQQLLIPWR